MTGGLCRSLAESYLFLRIQWRIYIVKFWTRPPPPGVQILSISCSFWENLAKSYVGALPWGVGAPSSGTGIDCCYRKLSTLCGISFVRSLCQWFLPETFSMKNLGHSSGSINKDLYLTCDFKVGNFDFQDILKSFFFIISCQTFPDKEWIPTIPL